MTVQINKYSSTLVQRFAQEKLRLQGLLGDNVAIEHIGSSAVGIGGKNIVDILIGVDNENTMVTVRDILQENGYHEGYDTHPDRIFMASSDAETTEGDSHVHICVKSSDTYNDFLILRDYLLQNPAKATEYFLNKQQFAEQAHYDRKIYKSLKSSYVSQLLAEAKSHLK